MSITKVAVSHTTLACARDAGAELAYDILHKLDGHAPDVLIVFASPAYDYSSLLQTLEQRCTPRLMLGCSSAGEFSGCGDSTASVSIMAIVAEDMRFQAAIGCGIDADLDAAVEQVLPVFSSAEHPGFPYRSALVLTDALAGYTDDIIERITAHTGGTYQLFGGGAADDARFQHTHVFFGTSVQSNAVVVLEMLSKRPVGLGVRHGWEPSGPPMRVTESAGKRLVSINATAAVDVFEDHANRSGQPFNRADPMPFFLNNVIGIDTGDGFKLRVPLSLDADGAIVCAAAVPQGATVRLMVASTASASDAARQASRAALDGLDGHKLAGSLLFDCAATRLRLGRDFGDALKAVAHTLGSDNFAGCNTYGQIARAEGQFSGFHNCTAIVCAIPE